MRIFLINLIFNIEKGLFLLLFHLNNIAKLHFNMFRDFSFKFNHRTKSSIITLILENIYENQ